MIRGIIIILILICSQILFSQSTSFSRNFAGSRKNIPLAILNNNANYFFVLRYNKQAHDLVVERRAKPSAEILNITPLKLDSVNASWFDYENLDHLFFEIDSRVFFLFEKVLNSERFIYLRELDTLGKLKGFVQIAHLKRDQSMTGVKFDFQLTRENKLLVIGTMFFHSGAAKKMATLYEPLKREKIYTKTLPIENAATGYSNFYACNELGDLFYLQVQTSLRGYQRKYSNHAQVSVPIFYYESLTLVSLINFDNSLKRYELDLHGLSELQSTFILANSKELLVALHYCQTDSFGSEQVKFYNMRKPIHVEQEIYSATVQLDSSIYRKLKYYDGTDFDAAADKLFANGSQIFDDNYIHFFTERNEDGFYKEILYRKVRASSGKIETQILIPRKIYFFKNRGNFKYLGTPVHLKHEEYLFIFLLENQQNEKVETNDFSFHKFRKQNQLKGGALVSYIISESGNTDKRIILRNGDYDFVPLKYKGNQPDFLFYLNKGKAERWGFLKLADEVR